MADDEAQVNELFAPPGSSLPQDVLHELLSITRLLSIDPQELFYKWESYALKMGTENTRLEYKTAKDFKKDLQDTLERETLTKGQHAAYKRNVGATPRAGLGGGDMFGGMMDGVVGATPSRGAASAKRKAGDMRTPAAKAVKNDLRSSPTPVPAATRDAPTTGFAERQNAGQVIETLNSHLPAAETPGEPPAESRVKLKANTELPKFAYKPMAMQLSSASEILDDRIDTFTELVQTHHQIPDSAFGNPAAQSTAEIVAVGRVACDQPDGRLNAASAVLETSRRMGAGLRIPLKFPPTISYDLFPGKIVALRGTNVSGEYFSVSEVISLPLLPPAASTPEDLSIHNDRLTSPTGSTRPLSYLIASGPYTPDTDLSYAAFHALLQRAHATLPDILLLSGPFLDLDHPLISSGDILPHLPPETTSKLPPDTTTLADIFRALISQPLQTLTRAHPAITILLIPSLRDAAASKHVSYPQDRFPKAPLGLPKQVQVLTNPITLSVNETVFGITSQDVLSELRRENVYSPGSSAPGGKFNDDLLARLSAQVIEQRHYFPVFPPQGREQLPKVADVPGEVPMPGGEPRLPIGASLDTGYLKLGEWLNVRPDVLVLPSSLTPFAKVVDSVLVINPGTLSKRRGPGTYASLMLQPRVVSDEEREGGAEVLGHGVFERARVDVVRI